MRRWRRMAGLAVAVTLAATACSGDDATVTSDTGAVETEAAGGEAAADLAVDADEAGRDGAYEESGGDGEVSPIQIAAPLGRHVIFTARLSLEVEDTAATVEQIRRAVETAGGFVAAADLRRVDRDGDEAQLAGSMTLRVPTDRLSTTLQQLKELATDVVDEGLDSQDVTEEYSDVQAQLRNLRALETELLALLADIRERSNDATQVLTVFERIRQVRGEIEQLEGRRQVLDDRIALATITVDLRPAPSAVPIAGDEWRPGEVARDALRSTVGALRTVADAAIWFGLTLLPILLLVLGLPLAVALGVRRTLRRRTARPAPPSPNAG